MLYLINDIITSVIIRATNFWPKNRKEVTTDMPGVMQFKYKGQFVIQTAWIS